MSLKVKFVFLRLLFLLETPLFLVGYLVASLLPKKTSTGNVVFVFPDYNMGGAEIVHSRITESVKADNPLIIFTRRSNCSSPLKDKFADFAIFDFSSWISIPFLSIFAWGWLLAFVNNCNCEKIFFSAEKGFYFWLPYLKKRKIIIDLIHSDFWANSAIANLWTQKIVKRVAITTTIKRSLEERYQELGLTDLEDRILVIPNAVLIAKQPSEEKFKGPLVALYVGRGSVEKRIDIIAEIAKNCKEKGLPISFKFIGKDIIDYIPASLQKYCNFIGEVKNEETAQYYLQSSFLIITSSNEGFPLSIMEAMANAVLPISTNVGSIKDHIKNGSNGILVPNSAKEIIVSEFVQHLLELSSNREKLEKLALNAYGYARSNFSLDVFCSSYRRLLLDSDS